MTIRFNFLILTILALSLSAQAQVPTKPLTADEEQKIWVLILLPTEWQTRW